MITYILTNTCRYLGEHNEYDVVATTDIEKAVDFLSTHLENTKDEITKFLNDKEEIIKGKYSWGGNGAKIQYIETL